MFRVMALVMTLLSGVFFVVDYYLAQHGRSILAATEEEEEQEQQQKNNKNNNNNINSRDNRTIHEEDKKASRCVVNSTQLEHTCKTVALSREDVRVKDEDDDDNGMFTNDNDCSSHKRNDNMACDNATDCKISCDKECTSVKV